MPCYSCGTDFGLLKKEVGCALCGFSFCSRCCKKQEIPSEGGELRKQLVCSKCCENLISGEKYKPSSGSPPLAHKKRMEALKKKSLSVDSGSQSPEFRFQWSNEKDRDIAERLHKLKRERLKELPPSESEIEERLARLKGMDPSKYRAPPIQVFRPTEKRTSVEQASDLMKQVTDEVALEATIVKPEDEIAARLAHLKFQAPSKMEEAGIPEMKRDQGPQEEMDVEKVSDGFQEDHKKLCDVTSKELSDLLTDPEYKKLLSNMRKEPDIHESDEDDEDETNKLVEKLMATNVDDEIEDLDSENGKSQKSQKMDEDSSNEEFPWCIICTEDAKMRCLGCEGDLYCMRCFKECHDSLDIRDHRTCPFLAPKNPLM